MTRLLKRTLLGLGLLAYALVFGEVFLRVMDPQALMPRHVTGTPWGVRGNVPDAVYRHWTPEIEVTLRINGQGMRADRDFPEEKPAGTCRIALLGDSYFMGYEATLADSIAGRLETELAEAGYKVEVLNFAVSGLGTAEMLRIFEARVPAFDPDAVVYQFHASDFADNLRAGLYAVRPDGTVEPTGGTYLPGVAIRDRLAQYAAYRWLIENSHLYTLVRERGARLAKALLAGLRGLGPSAAEAAEVGETYPGARLTGTLLTHARRLAGQAGIDFYALDIPTRSPERGAISTVPHLRLDVLTAERMVDPAERLAQAWAAGEQIYRAKGHLHFTPEGNRIAAEMLAEAIERGSASRLARCPAPDRQSAGGS